MPPVNILYGQVYSKDITPSSARTAVSLFVPKKGMKKIKKKVRSEVEEPDYAQGELRRRINKLTADSRESSCDVVIAQCRERFSFI